MKNEEIEKELDNMVQMYSKYATHDELNYEDKKKSMLNEIETLVTMVSELTASLSYRIAIAYRNFCSWYMKGNDRKEFYEKEIYYLEKSIALDQNYVSSRIELCRILIDEKIVRNLEKALVLADELKIEKQFPEWMDSFYQKANRWLGNFDIPKDCNFKKLNPTPAVLGEERTELRKMLISSIKEKQDSQKIIAKRLYNLALFVGCLYGGHDCNTGVIGYQYDAAVKKAKKICMKFNFEYIGRINDSKFLSEQDYSRIEKVFGIRDRSIIVNDIEGMLC